MHMAGCISATSAYAEKIGALAGINLITEGNLRLRGEDLQSGPRAAD